MYVLNAESVMVKSCVCLRKFSCQKQTRYVTGSQNRVDSAGFGFHGTLAADSNRDTKITQQFSRVNRSPPYTLGHFEGGLQPVATL